MLTKLDDLHQKLVVMESIHILWSHLPHTPHFFRLSSRATISHETRSYTFWWVWLGGSPHSTWTDLRSHGIIGCHITAWIHRGLVPLNRIFHQPHRYTHRQPYYQHNENPSYVSNKSYLKKYSYVERRNFSLIVMSGLVVAITAFPKIFYW